MIPAATLLVPRVETVWLSWHHEEDQLQASEMLDASKLFFRTSSSGLPARILSPRISAVELTSDRHDHPRLGRITQLVQSCAIEICGEGFNERTVKVRYENSFYFVFRADVKPIEPAKLQN